MKEVKIYTIVSDQLSPPITGESFCTDMVRHSDYAELEAKCAALAADNDKAMESLKQADAVVKLAHEKFSALAAENEGLKGGIKQAFEDMEAHHDDDGLFSYDADGEPMDALLRLCDAQGSITSLMNYETPATDDFLAEVREQAHKEGAHFVANRMLAAWDAGFIEDTAKNAADIARMILTSTEFMADAPEGDFDRSFADGVLKDIAAQLRKGAAL
ncbi:Eae-like protein [Salmonella enterica]|nr:Eae-like protein [Salmonella enterica]